MKYGQRCWGERTGQIMDALDFYTGTAIVVTLAIAWCVWRL
jgi:hypothetical protein